MPLQEALGEKRLEWPYPVNYDKVNHVYSDIFVVGGGTAGMSAALSAAEHGATVAVADKSPMKRAGNAGAGIDHWNELYSNPACPVTPEEVAQTRDNGANMMHREYIGFKGTWEALMKLEEYGLPIRDKEGQFADSDFYDPDTQLLKSYDYSKWIGIKLRGGYNLQPTLWKAARANQNISLYNRVMITSLLTEDGAQGTRVAGATGFSLETGEFYVFHAKCVVIASGYICGMWTMSTELTGSSYRWDPNDVGEGFAMAWNAGALVYNMHKNGNTHGSHPFAWPRFGVGNPQNTWSPCTMVDSDGKSLPWVDRNGNACPDEASRRAGGRIVPDLTERIRTGEFRLPLYADLSAMSAHERRSIWGLMIGNEGKTRYTIYDLYTKSGFNPETDLLGAPPVPPEEYAPGGSPYFHGVSGAAKPWRTERGAQGELYIDWDSMTTIPGLYAAGASAGHEGASMACSSGRYAGARAAERAANTEQCEIDPEQLEAEHKRVYAPVKRTGAPDAIVSWKELWAGTARVMQCDCAEYISPDLLEHGLWWLDSIARNEAQQTFARTPHELARVLECETRITVSKAIIQANLARIAAIENDELHIQEAPQRGGIRSSYDIGDRLLFIRQEGTEIIREYKEPYFWLKPPYASSYLENYRIHSEGENHG